MSSSLLHRAIDTANVKRRCRTGCSPRSRSNSGSSVRKPPDDRRVGYPGGLAVIYHTSGASELAGIRAGQGSIHRFRSSGSALDRHHRSDSHYCCSDTLAAVT